MMIEEQVILSLPPTLPLPRAAVWCCDPSVFLRGPPVTTIHPLAPTIGRCPALASAAEAPAVSPGASVAGPRILLRCPSSTISSESACAVSAKTGALGILGFSTRLLVMQKIAAARVFVCSLASLWVQTQRYARALTAVALVAAPPPRLGGPSCGLQTAGAQLRAFLWPHVWRRQLLQYASHSRCSYLEDSIVCNSARQLSPTGTRRQESHTAPRIPAGECGHGVRAASQAAQPPMTTAGSPLSTRPATAAGRGPFLVNQPLFSLRFPLSSRAVHDSPHDRRQHERQQHVPCTGAATSI